jgi:sialic acid synthase SpsE
MIETKIHDIRLLLIKALKEKHKVKREYSEHTMKLALDTISVYVQDALDILEDNQAEPEPENIKNK